MEYQTVILAVVIVYLIKKYLKRRAIKKSLDEDYKAAKYDIDNPSTTDTQEGNNETKPTFCLRMNMFYPRPKSSVLIGSSQGLKIRLENGDTFSYDEWNHYVRIEKGIMKDPNRLHYKSLLDGGVIIPEDAIDTKIALATTMEAEDQYQYTLSKLDNGYGSIDPQDLVGFEQPDPQELERLAHTTLQTSIFRDSVNWAKLDDATHVIKFNLPYDEQSPLLSKDDRIEIPTDFVDNFHEYISGCQHLEEVVGLCRSQSEFSKVIQQAAKRSTIADELRILEQVGELTYAKTIQEIYKLVKKD